MPNWVENILIIEGNNKVLNKFVKFAKSRIKGDGEEKPYIQPLDFSKFIPYPKKRIHQDKIKELAYDLSHTDDKEKFIKERKISSKALKEVMLYNLTDETNKDSVEYLLGWHTTHWGTKWNSRCYGKNPTKVDKNTYIYTFETAWSPPIQIIDAMTAKFPNLTFTFLYGEPGNYFSGRLRINSKNVIESVQSKYKKNWGYPAAFMRKYKLIKCKKVLGYG